MNEAINPLDRRRKDRQAEANFRQLAIVMLVLALVSVGILIYFNNKQTRQLSDLQYQTRTYTQCLAELLVTAQTQTITLEQLDSCRIAVSPKDSPVASPIVIPSSVSQPSNPQTNPQTNAQPQQNNPQPVKPSEGLLPDSVPLVGKIL